MNHKISKCYQDEKFREFWPLIERAERWEKNVWQWACERGLNNSTIEKQYNKLLEEFGELKTALQAGTAAEIKDAIGDMLVVLAIMNRMVGSCLSGSIIGFSESDLGTEGDYDFFEDEDVFESITGITTSLSFLGSHLTHENFWAALSILDEDIVSELDIIARCNNMTVIECCEYAYNEIKDRKGEMVDGYFIKESE